MASAERVAVLAPIVIGDERAADALTALLQTQPADSGSAANDLADLATVLLRRSVGVIDGHAPTDPRSGWVRRPVLVRRLDR